MSLGELILKVLEVAWPFQKVEYWEEGCYYIFGRFWKRVGPGTYPVLPWFFEIVAVSVAPAIISSGRCDITLSDNRTLSFEATAWARVADVVKAINEVDNYRETSTEILASVLSDRLGDVEPERLSPQKRGRLFSDLQKWVAAEAKEKGIDITKVRFKSFVLAPRTYRLLIDQGNSALSW